LGIGLTVAVFTIYTFKSEIVMRNGAMIRLVTGLVLFAAITSMAQSAGAQPNNLIFQDNFRDGGQWLSQFEEPGSLRFANGTADLVAPAGATLWFRPKLSGAIAIEYQIQAVSEGGPYDRVSDLNCFWMATDPQQPDTSSPPQRSGKFEEYNTLLTYYVGLGGNRNTTTRFRRYIADPVVRPYRLENDRSEPLLEPNVWLTIRIVANGSDVRYYRNGALLFHYDDAEPYTKGWFGFRTTLNHMRIRDFRVYRLQP
jgi:hypothetical protein